MGIGKEHHYDTADITVRYNATRCIHARECVRGLPSVFDTARRPWITPDGTKPDEIAEVIMRCPTGALHFERNDDGTQEPMPDHNEVDVVANGPLYARGELDILRPDKTTILVDTRIALCRCGGSKNKPFCDNSHIAILFSAGGNGNDGPLEQSLATGEKLKVVPSENGPFLVNGPLEIRDPEGTTIYRGTDTALCRCGGSSNKPFCDGTHEKIGFRDA